MDRTRRLRQTAVMRSMVRENHVRTEELIYPLFVMEGENIVQPVESMPGICQYSVDRMNEGLDRVKALQIPAILILEFRNIRMKWGAGLMMSTALYRPRSAGSKGLPGSACDSRCMSL